MFLVEVITAAWIMFTASVYSVKWRTTRGTSHGEVVGVDGWLWEHFDIVEHPVPLMMFTQSIKRAAVRFIEKSRFKSKHIIF